MLYVISKVSLIICSEFETKTIPIHLKIQVKQRVWQSGLRQNAYLAHVKSLKMSVFNSSAWIVLKFR